jgi:hypothetical protein
MKEAAPKAARSIDLIALHNSFHLARDRKSADFANQH